MKKLNKVFVYGTLKEGKRNHHVIPAGAILKKSRAYINNADLYEFVGGDFPCLIPGTGKVFGEIFEIREELLKETMEALDFLEGYRPNNPYNLYNREVKSLHVDSGQLEAYVYVYNTEGPMSTRLGDKIENGTF